MVVPGCAAARCAVGGCPTFQLQDPTSISLSGISCILHQKAAFLFQYSQQRLTDRFPILATQVCVGWCRQRRKAPWSPVSGPMGGPVTREIQHPAVTCSQLTAHSLHLPAFHVSHRLDYHLLCIYKALPSPSRPSNSTSGSHQRLPKDCVG